MCINAVIGIFSCFLQLFLGQNSMLLQFHGIADLCSAQTILCHKKLNVIITAVLPAPKRAVINIFHVNSTV